MPDYRQFKLPDVGEGLTEGEILRWLVRPGDQVTINQPIVEVETAKAAVELPSPFEGTVAELHAPEGATVPVGTPIITVDVDPDGAVEPPPAESPPASAGALRDDMSPEIPRPPDDEGEPGTIGGPGPGGRTSVLVGYGPRSGAAKRRPRKAPAGSGPTGGAGTGPAAPTAPPLPGSAPPAAPPLPAAPPPAAAPPELAGPSGPASSGPAVRPRPVLAKPPVRKLARDLGVDLRSLSGSGPAGVITRADVAAAAEPAASPPARPATIAGWDASREQRIPIRGVRKHTAAAMVASAFTAPHVTEFVAVDMAATMLLRRRVAALPEFAGVKVSPLLFVAAALLAAVRRHPMMNSSWDERAQEIVVKQYVNLGIAAATERGLIVPNVKDAGALSLRDLAVALADLTETARAGRVTPADLAGGTITITNVGVFGVDAGTPILNPGEAAILAFGAVRPMPWVVDGQVAV